MNHLILNDISIFNRNVKETKEIYNSIFIRQDYNFVTKSNAPKIIDCGAHIGLATIYFKRKFPKAKIVAIEANPHTIKLFKKNIRANGIKDVEIFWGALSKKSGDITLYIDSNYKNAWSWDDSIIKNIWSDRPLRKIKKKIQVPTIHLSKIITNKIDLIKMDIEGAEFEVIEEVQKKLSYVNSIIIEVHLTKKTPVNSLQKIRSILKKHDFKLHEYPIDWTIFINAIKNLR